VVTGFQGVAADSGELTTLSRGGSDTTAVALAAAVNAEVCEIYTDVPGVFSADPRIVPNARKLPVVSFDEMLEMAASGAGVLQLRSVEYARNHAVRIHCRSSFEEGPGTFVLDEQETMERPLVTAVTHSLGDARITLTSLPDRPGIAGKVLTALAEANVNVDDIIQNEPVSADHRADMSFTVPKDDLAGAVAALEAIKDDLGIGDIATDDHIGKVSLVGAGMKSHPGVAAKAFRTLGEHNINIEMIATSPIKISCVIHENDVGEAVRAWHTAFDLDDVSHTEVPQ
jgi:aspartate kinase